MEIFEVLTLGYQMPNKTFFSSAICLQSRQKFTHCWRQDLKFSADIQFSDYNWMIFDKKAVILMKVLKYCQKH